MYLCVYVRCMRVAVTKQRQMLVFTFHLFWSRVFCLVVCLFVVHRPFWVDWELWILPSLPPILKHEITDAWCNDQTYVCFGHLNWSSHTWIVSHLISFWGWGWIFFLQKKKVRMHWHKGIGNTRVSEKKNDRELNAIICLRWGGYDSSNLVHIAMTAFDIAMCWKQKSGTLWKRTYKHR